LTVLADTGAVFALLCRDDIWHRRVVDYWEQSQEEIRLPEPILPELCYLLATRIGGRAEAAFVRAVADGEYPLEPLVAGKDITRAADLIHTYHDAAIGFVDAAIAAIAERLRITTLLTTDRRHFPIFRLRHLPALTLAP